MHEKILSVHGLELAYVESGSPGKPKLLCLHGWLDNAASFFPILPFLKDHFHIFCFELPGHGKSGHLEAPAHYHLLDSISFIEGIRKELDWGKINFFCHSLGGVLACLYASCFPENTSFLMSIESMGPIYSAPEESVANLKKYVQNYHSLKNRKSKFHRNLESCIKARTKDGSLGEKEAKELTRRGVVKAEQGYYWSFDRKLQLPSSSRMTKEQVDFFLQNIETEYHLIKADAGIKILDLVYEERAKQMKKVKVHHVSGGHHVHMEDPERISNILKEVFIEN